MEKARRAKVIVEYDGKDISEELSKMIISLSYTDNTDKADNLKIVVEDRDGNWASSWYPKVAAKGN